MISFRKNLVRGKRVQDGDGIVGLLEQKIPVEGIFLVCASDEGKNLMEIISGTEIFKDVYRHKRFTVLGIASGVIEAREVTAEVIRNYIGAGKALSDLKKNLQKR